MRPPSPTVLDKSTDNVPKSGPTGWEGAKFPLSKLDLSKLARDYGRKGRGTTRNVIISVKTPAHARFSQVPVSARVIARRKQGISSPRSSGGNTPRISPHVSAGNVRVLSRTSNGWSWLSVKFKEIRSNRSVKPRKGELPPELIKAIWGSHNLRHCQLSSSESLKGFGRKKISVDSELELRKIRSKRQDQSGVAKSAENLMDILLHNWTYFEHSHSTVGKTDKQVHAKYCENEFGHFLLSDGQQIHGQFHVNLNVLIKDLRKLLTKLRSQIPTAYQELPSWKSPRLEEDPDLELPPMPPMPQLHPISGLAPIPSEEEENIPNDYAVPVFKSPMPREHPPLVLPEALKVPPLKLPVMPVLNEDETTIDYDAYKEEPMPVFVLPSQQSLPVWEEPRLAELPLEPEYLLPQIISPPVLESMPPFRPPLLDPRPCEKSYYELGNDEKGICDGLCSKHGHRHHFVPGQHRREPCFAKPPQLLRIPPPPFPDAESVLFRIEFQLSNGNQNLSELHILSEPVFEAPFEEQIPPFEAPILKQEPVFVPPPPPYLPSWKEPRPPPPLGWISGQRPVFLIDCSGTMTGERMEAVQACLKVLFSPGGQAEIAITHFDIIMYSFDAWSFGDIENSYVYKQAAGSRYLRPLEPMRVKSPETFEAALNWVSRWRPAGTTNLSKAIDLALSRTSADCIYLFSEGKSDKPVLIIESLRRQAQIQRNSIPIYTVGMRTSKLRCRFLKRMAAVSGGHFTEFDFNFAQPKPLEGKEEDLADMQWAQKMVEDNLRTNAASGRKEDLRDIIKRVESKYPSARHTVYLEAHKQKLIEMEALHRQAVQVVQNENAESQANAKKDYEKTVIEIQERNRQNLCKAKSEWEEKVENVKKTDKQMIEDVLKWKDEVTKIKQMNDRTGKDAKEKFLKDLKEVEEKNCATMEDAKERHIAELERIKKKHMEKLEEVARRQKDSNEKVATMNRATSEDHERTCRAIRESNAVIYAQAQKLHEEKLQSVKIQNGKAILEAQQQFEKQCEDVRTENARKKTALAQLIESVKRRKEHAVLSHKAEVARVISAHEEKIKAYNKMNSENEEKVRNAWKRACDNIDKENMAAVRKAMDDFEAEQIRVQEENIKLAEKRLELKRLMAQVVRENDEIVKQKKVEWKEACLMVEKQHEMDVAKAKETHKEKTEHVKLRNAEKLQSSLLEHKAKVAAVESYNETVRPYVEASNAVRSEIRRIEAFLQCIADSILPQDRHIMEKKIGKSSLDKDLDLLAVSDATLNTQMLIEALRSAYGKNWKAEKKADKHSERMSVVPDKFGSKSKFTGLIPIHPARAIPHNCLEPEELKT